MEGKVRTALVISGSGTDANAVMEKYVAGFIPNIELVSLISTNRVAGGLDKARILKVTTKIFDRQENGVAGLNALLAGYVQEEQIKLLFLLGCIVKIYPIPGVAMWNIHPADPHDFGGNKMYGLKVHERVLENVIDLINRGKKKPGDDFFTYPTVHEATLDYDCGQPLLRAFVKIPQRIILDRLNGAIDITEAAKRLQQHVLPYEWAILPTAVNIAAMKILDEQKTDAK